MSLLPPNNSTTAAKPAATSTSGQRKRKPAPRRSEPLKDTPNPPTPPEPESIPEPASMNPKKSASKPRSGTLEHRLTEAFAGVAILPSFAGDQYSSFILASRSEAFAHNLAELAKVNKRVKTILENSLDGGVYGGVFFSGAAMLLPILWAYGILPSPGFDPFSGFYPTVPDGVKPRSASRAGSRVATPGAGPSTPAPGAPSRSAPVSPDSPVGVVTVKPGAHPPINPAAL